MRSSKDSHQLHSWLAYMLAVYASLGTHLSCSTVSKPWCVGQIFVQGIGSTSYSQSTLSSYSSLVCADTGHLNMMISTLSSVHLYDNSLASALIEFCAEVGLSTECIHSHTGAHFSNCIAKVHVM